MENFVSNSDTVIDELIGQVERSMNLLDDNVSQEYQEALRFVPALVERESPIIDFLRTEGFHSLRAANRMALYWKRRREFFGEDRWLKPIDQNVFPLTVAPLLTTQTGGGALTPDQIELMRTGFVVVTDSPQASVCLSEKMQEDGLIMFHVVNSDHRPVNDPAAMDAVKKLRACLPFKTKKVVVGRLFEPDREHLVEYMGFHQHRVSQTVFGSSEIVFGNSVRDTINGLEEKGLERACIPLSFGGDYVYYEKFNNWIRSRLSIEGAMIGAPPVRNTATANEVASRGLSDLVSKALISMATTGTQDEEDNSSSSGKRVVERLPGETEAAFEKRRAYIYGKRSYARKRRKLGNLQEQCQFLEEVKMARQTENYRLQNLLKQARAAVMNFSEVVDWH
eukprot:scaffold2719_cov153-Amphora_coffeaeformis.AAC.2